ncbi:MAG: DUF5053 domain-containing protein [Bacteroidales bacterium]|nr:DUF5053 domain-containing protein [Bacteroidales bacterium]
METVTKRNERVQVTDVKKRLSSIYMKITWREIAGEYFGKSPSWLYHKLDGIDGNGGKGGFTPEELLVLKGALTDLSDKIRLAAEQL